MGPGLRLWPLFLFVRLKNTRHISILRRYFLDGGTLLALGRKTRQGANVGRVERIWLFTQKITTVSD